MSSFQAVSLHLHLVKHFRISKTIHSDSEMAAEYHEQLHWCDGFTGVSAIL